MANDDFDLWDVVRAFSSELRAKGEAEWSRRINQAMGISGLPGEVIGETRIVLETLKADGAAERAGLKPQLDTILQHFDSLLGAWGSWGKHKE